MVMASWFTSVLPPWKIWTFIFCNKNVCDKICYNTPGRDANPSERFGVINFQKRVI